MPNKSTRIKLAIAAGILLVAGLGAYSWIGHLADEKDRISYTAFVDRVRSGEIVKVVVEGKAITATGKQGERYLLYEPAEADLPQLLLSRHIDFSVHPEVNQSKWVELLLFVVLIIPIFFLMKRLALFGRSKAKPTSGTHTGTLFTDVAGVEEAKTELQEIVEFLKAPDRFSKLGGKMPRGVLLTGPPGTGKTLLARAVAGEAGVPFFAISGSDFVEMYVGVGASRVRDLFAEAKKVAPCIIFMDELDAVGKRRDSGNNGSNDERDQTLNQMLVEMDGFTVNSGVVVIAATNRPEILDPALLRPGRFDRQVAVGSPDIKGREEILKVHAQNVPLGEDVDLKVLARGTSGFSGADLANVINEAAILAARNGKELVAMADIEAARDKVLMGGERKSLVLSDKSKRNTACHEAGHVMVAKLVPGCDPVHKVSIVPRGRALGVTLQIPEEDIHCYTKEMLLGHIKVLMGGRAAEELVFNSMTTGAGNDIARATEVARRMVCEWGMSSLLGPVAFGGAESSGENKLSDATALAIDQEVGRIVTTAYSDVAELLRMNRETLDRLTDELVLRETLDAAEIERILAQ